MESGERVESGKGWSREEDRGRSQGVGGIGKRVGQGRGKKEAKSVRGKRAESGRGKKVEREKG